MRLRPILGLVFALLVLATVALAAPARPRASARAAAPLGRVTRFDFETGADSNATWPAGWRRGGNVPAATVRLDAGAHGGARAARIDSPDSVGVVALTRVVPDSDRVGAVAVRFAAWLRTADAGRADLWVRVDGAVHGITTVDLGARAPHGTTTWTRYELLVPVAEEAQRIVVAVRLERGGSMWIDDATLELLPPEAVPPAAPLARAYLDTALDSLVHRSVQSSTLNWGVLKRRAHVYLVGARTPRESDDAIRYAVHAVEANARFVPPDTARLEAALAVDPQAPAAPLPAVDLYDGIVAYADLVDCTTPSDLRRGDYAGRVQNAIAHVDTLSLPERGWLVDLRHVSGGDVEPLLAGLGPLFGDGVLGYGIRTDGRRIVFRYAGGTCTRSTGPKPAALVRAPFAATLRHPNQLLAIVVGPQTSGAGEVVAHFLRALPNSRVFGQATVGLGTVDETVRLRDGAELRLSTAFAADRDGKRLAGGIVPDERVTPGPPGPGMRDPEIETALRWMHDEITKQRQKR